jgi:choline/glycine/proline betaine transport protein
VKITMCVRCAGKTSSVVDDDVTAGRRDGSRRAERMVGAVSKRVEAAVLLIGGAVIALQTASVTIGLPFWFILLVMVYSLYVGLNTEYSILQSEEFRERVSDMAESGEIEVDVSGGDIVTGVRDAESDD